MIASIAQMGSDPSQPSPGQALETERAKVAKLKVKLERSRADLQTILAKRDHALVRLEAARAEAERLRGETDDLRSRLARADELAAAFAVELGASVAATDGEARSIAQLHERRIRDFLNRAAVERSLGAAAAPRTGPPLAVLAPAGERTILSLVADPRLIVLPELETRPDLLVLAAHQPSQLERLAGPQSEALIARAAGARAVVFDSSGEALPHGAERTALLHGFLERLGLAPEQGVYLTQDRTYASAYQAAYSRRMRVVVCDFHIRQFFHELGSGGGLAYSRKLQRYRGRAVTRPRRFVSLNLTARVSKLFFLLSLLRDGFWDRGFISFGGFGRTSLIKSLDAHGFAKRMQATPGFADLAAELTPLLAQLDSKGEVLLGEMGARRRHGMVLVHTSDADLPEYDASWFSVVTETEMTSQPLRITEKPFSALVNFHPLVMFGNPGALGMIRRLGFETFQGARIS